MHRAVRPRACLLAVVAVAATVLVPASASLAFLSPRSSLPSREARSSGGASDTASNAASRFRRAQFAPSRSPLVAVRLHSSPVGRAPTRGSGGGYGGGDARRGGGGRGGRADSDEGRRGAPGRRDGGEPRRSYAPSRDGRGRPNGDGAGGSARGDGRGRPNAGGAGGNARGDDAAERDRSFFERRKAGLLRRKAKPRPSSSSVEDGAPQKKKKRSRWEREAALLHEVIWR